MDVHKALKHTILKHHNEKDVIGQVKNTYTKDGVLIIEVDVNKSFIKNGIRL